MSEDARNSIYLWVGALTCFGLLWAALHFDLLVGVPNEWLWPVVGIIVAINMLQTVWDFWKRRASSSDNPNRNGSSRPVAEV